LIEALAQSSPTAPGRPTEERAAVVEGPAAPDAPEALSTRAEQAT
jgi:hypothetical protein